MPKYSLRKSFPDIGEIEYKVASSRSELEGAFALIYKEYLSRGFILPEHYKSGMRITLYNSLPEATVFVALKNKEVVATNAIIPDSQLGLPLDMGYKAEADKLRNSGRRICEGGYLAIKTELFGNGFFSLFNLKKLDFIFSLFKVMFQYALLHGNFDDLCIVTNPRYMLFKFLPFEISGPVKYYGYDLMSVKKKAAVFKRLDLRKMRKFIDQPQKILGKRLVLYKMFLASKIPAQLYQDKFILSPEDLRYFFVEKSDILKKLKNKQKEYLRSCYGLTKDEFAKLLKG